MFTYIIIAHRKSSFCRTKVVKFEWYNNIIFVYYNIVILYIVYEYWYLWNSTKQWNSKILVDEMLKIVLLYNYILFPKIIVTKI